MYRNHIPKLSFVSDLPWLYHRITSSILANIAWKCLKYTILANIAWKCLKYTYNNYMYSVRPHVETSTEHDKIWFTHFITTTFMCSHSNCGRHTQTHACLQISTAHPKHRNLFQINLFTFCTDYRLLQLSVERFCLEVSLSYYHHRVSLWLNRWLL